MDASKKIGIEGYSAGWYALKMLEWCGRMVLGVKGKMCSAMVRPAMLYALKAMSVTRAQKKLQTAEVKMLKWSLGVMNMNRIEDEGVRMLVKVKKTKIKWLVHLLRIEKHVRKRVKQLEAGKKREGDPKED